MSLLVVVAISGVVLTVAYFSYGRFLCHFLDLASERPTPAVELRDGVDYDPIEPKFLLSQHFSAIAAAGPIVGPILATGLYEISRLHARGQSAGLGDAVIAWRRGTAPLAWLGLLLAALGRHAWRPAHLHFLISAPGHERLVTPVFRDGARYLDSDAVFGVRRSQIAPWVRHAPGRTPDGQSSALPFFTLDLTFVLKANRGDTP